MVNCGEANGGCYCLGTDKKYQQLNVNRYLSWAGTQNSEVKTR
jgi:hypothetical protein